MTLSRGFTWILIVSLAVNFLAIGGFAGMFFANQQNKTAQQSVISAPRISNSSFNGAGFLRALPPEERKKTWANISENKGKYRKNARQVRKLRRQVYFLLLAEQLDDDAIKNALEKLRAAENRASADGQMLILKILADLDVDTRREAVKAMSQPHQRKVK